MQVGRSAAEVLTEELPALVASLSFKKSMRWRPDAGGCRASAACMAASAAMSAAAAAGRSRPRTLACSWLAWPPAQRPGSTLGLSA